MSTTHRATGQSGTPPTAKQQRYLRQLATVRGVSFVPPRTCFEASRLIDQLKRRRPKHRADVARELKAVRRDLATANDSARVRAEELEGYGSTATWKERS